MQSVFVAEPFSIAVTDRQLRELHARIRATRWPPPSAAAAWEHGADLEYLQALCEYWLNDFDWRARERALNARRRETVVHSAIHGTPNARSRQGTEEKCRRTW